MSNILKRKYFWGILIVLLWGFFYLLRTPAITSLAATLSVALLYALSITSIIYFLHQVILPKLDVFSFKLQLVLKSFFYASGILIGYLLIKIPEILFLLPYRVFLDETIYGFFRAVTILFTAPLSRVDFNTIVSESAIAAAASFFALLVLIALVSIILSYVETRWRTLQMERQQQLARLKLLEMQMQPHFLFNTLNSIVSIVQSDPHKAEELLINLSDFLRYNFNLAEKKFAAVSEELEFAEQYLKLIAARYAGKITWEINLHKECVAKQIPVMLIQPILENSVKHGMKENDLPLHIRIACSQRKNNIVIEIKDNGSGLQLTEGSNFPPKGHSLDIIRQRLQILYDRKGGLEIKSNRGTQVRILLPEK